MKIYKEKLTPHVDDVICDICGTSCKKEPDESGSIECATLHTRWGYFSNQKDMEEHTCHMCEECYEKVKGFIEALGGKVEVKEYFPLS